MSIKVETFNRFNNGIRRPDRRRHLELCGFKLTESCVHPNDFGLSPYSYAVNRARARESEIDVSHVHIVYMIGGKDSDGWSYYDYYTKMEKIK